MNWLKNHKYTITFVLAMLAMLFQFLVVLRLAGVI